MGHRKTVLQATVLQATVLRTARIVPHPEALPSEYLSLGWQTNGQGSSLSEDPYPRI
jgi:hypothetical protein